MSGEDPFELADKRDREADRLAQQSEELEASVSETREDWERKRADRSVPGAPAPEDGGEDRSAHDASPAAEAPPPEP